MRHFLETTIKKESYEKVFCIVHDIGRMLVGMTTPQTRASLAFDPSNPAHEFEPGKIEDQNYTIDASFYLPRPMSWNSSFWGLYSTAKYMFMMDCLGNSFQDSWNNWERVNEVRLAYEEYCADPAHGRRAVS